MKKWSLWLSFLVIASWFSITSRAADSAKDGDWGQKAVVLQNTSEAALMVRVGDIDNLGFGWPSGFDVFSGNSTPSHGFPWTIDAADPDGTDRIMVLTSYTGTPPAGTDGYVNSTRRPDNSVRPIVLAFSLGSLKVHDAVFQLFVDDFQAPMWRGQYSATINGKEFIALQDQINSLVQTGPIGKLITVLVPSSLLPEIATGWVELKIDDLTTGAGDGYAIDFVKLLINRSGGLESGTVSGRVTDAINGQPIAGAIVSAFDQSTVTDSAGRYILDGVPAGLARVLASSVGYGSSAVSIDVLVGQTRGEVNFQLPRAATTLEIFTAVELEFFGFAGVNYALQYSSDLQNWILDEVVTGQGQLVTKLRSARNPQQKYWRVKEQ